MSRLPWETATDHRNRQLNYLRMIARANDLSGWDREWGAWEQECVDLNPIAALFPFDAARAGESKATGVQATPLPRPSGSRGGR